MDDAVEPHQSFQLNFSSSDLKLSKEYHEGMLTNNTKRALISFFGRGTHARSREDMVFAILTGSTQLKNDTKYQPSPGFYCSQRPGNISHKNFKHRCQTWAGKWAEKYCSEFHPAPFSNRLASLRFGELNCPIWYDGRMGNVEQKKRQKSGLEDFSFFVS